MGCPVHVWVPLMAAAAPVVRVAKDRIVAFRYRSSSRTTESPTLAESASAPRRWAPIDPHGGD
jgi:hypothetical protein